MARQQRREEAPVREQDDVQPRQPSWREQTPARPRKRVRRHQATAPGFPDKPGGRGRQTARIPAWPARETWLLVLRMGALLLTAGAATVGLIYLLHMPGLAVGRTSTEVGGIQRIAPEEIYTRSGIDGRNVLLLRANDIAAEVETTPGVAQARVHVRLPNQVIIDIVEHAPLVAWQTVTGTLWLAADGSQVPQAGAAPPLRFIDRSDGRLANDAALHKLILQDLGAVHAAQPALSQFYYAEEPGLYYQAPEGWDVWLGEGGPMADKLALAQAAGRDIAREGTRPKVIDVRQSERKAMWW